MSDTIYKKFAAAWESVENPPLDSVNPGYKSKYASLGAVMRVIRKACKDNGKLLMMYCDNKEQAEGYFARGFDVCMIGTDLGIYIKTEARKRYFAL